jgi:N-acetylmuramoyl-L-alanine amidase
MNRTSIKFLYFVNLSVLLLFLINLNISTAYAKSFGKIVVDPGHGGYDPGVVLSGIIEKKVSLDISMRLVHYLGQSGNKVIMTRNIDTALYKLSNKGSSLKTRDLNARVNIINNSSAKLFISIHVDSVISYKKCTGSIVYYDSRSSKSKALAESIQSSLNKVIMNNQKRHLHTARPANFYILRRTGIPGVLIETAFITNRSERTLLKNEVFKNKLALAIANGIKNSKIYNSINAKKKDPLNKNIKKIITAH